MKGSAGGARGGSVVNAGLSIWLDFRVQSGKNKPLILLIFFESAPQFLPQPGLRGMPIIADP